MQRLWQSIILVSFGSFSPSPLEHNATQRKANATMVIKLGRAGTRKTGHNSFDEELESLTAEVTERDGVIRTGGTAAAFEISGGPSSSSSSSSSSSFLLKVVAFIGLALLVLFWSDAMEIKEISPDGGSSNAAAGSTGHADMDGLQGHVIHKTQVPVTPSNNGMVENADSDGDSDSSSEPQKEQEPDQTSEPGLATERHTYKRRGQPMSDTDRQAMTEKWGSWTLVDDKERPTGDIYAKYPNRDIPRADFPANAWQIDTEYLDKFLPEAIALVERAQNAILAEYGYNSPDETEMFDLALIPEALVADHDFNGFAHGDKGGWTTTRSWSGMQRRLLHAVMTEDVFVFAMGGHSAAAGHGNHFIQSYTLQVQWILESVFARLGVRHQSRNFGNGGLGTLHNGLAAGSIYGPDVDMLAWDSGMTEGEPQAHDVFARQALLGGKKVPILLGLSMGVLTALHDNADVDVAVMGNGNLGIPEMSDLADLEKIPWAAQYMRCSGDVVGICNENKYIGVCWVDRDDFTPPPQLETQGGRAGWHPGNRTHQLAGRLLAFFILRALKEALIKWKDVPGYVLADEDWHVTSYYDNIRSKVGGLAADVGFCNAYAESELAFVCNYPMQARTEFTPRAFPALSNIRSLMPSDEAALINPPTENVYEAPDVFIPALHPPAGAVDVLNIVENGIDFQSVLNPCYESFYMKPSFASPPKVPIGKGFRLDVVAGNMFCDGSVDSFCARGPSDNCFVQGHNDFRGGLLFDGYSGWFVINIPNLKNGFVVIKIETWHQSGENSVTADWTSINNEGRRSMLRYDGGNSTAASSAFSHGTRNLYDYGANLIFEYAIDGVITSLNMDDFKARLHQVQRVVETVTILNDPNFTGGIEKEVEVAFRITGCARTHTFKISHVFWS